MPKMRLGWYAGVSAALAASVVLSAFHQRPNFYSAMVYLSQSNFCLLVLVNFTLFFYSSFIYGLTRLCFGPLRAVETEQLTERAWFAVTETCLAMTIFRNEIGAWFLVMFTALLTGKVWGWIGEGRVEILEQQPPANPRLFHTRLVISLTMSCIYDMWILRYAVNTVVEQARPSMMVMFLFEFAVLATSSWRTAARYILSLAEQNIIKKQTRTRLLERRQEIREQREAALRQREQAAANGDEQAGQDEHLPSEDDIDEMDIEVPGWAAKGEWVLWLDLFADGLKIGIYIAFFSMLPWRYGLPIHVMRDLFMTGRDFIKRLNALMRYRRAIQDMNKHPDATDEDLQRDSTCIICREEMTPWNPDNNPGALDRVRPKKLPCGHILHLGCLKSWLERQQVCPTCRTPVTGERSLDGGNRAAVQIQIGAPQRRLAQAQPQVQPVVQQGQHAQNAQPAAFGPGDNHEDVVNDLQQRPPQGHRPRVFNLGPIRLGFGANAQQVRELAQQFGMPQAAMNHGQPPVDTASQQEPTLQTQGSSRGDSIPHISTLLQQAEQMVMRELQSIQATQQELQTIQLLLTELHQLRQRQQHRTPPDQASNGQAQPGILPHLPMTPGFPQYQPTTIPFQSHANPFIYPQNHTNLQVTPRITAPFMARHGTSANTTTILSGSSELPEGVVIPPGWTLMPLQRLDDLNDGHFPAPSGMNGLDADSSPAGGNQNMTTSERQSSNATRPSSNTTSATVNDVSGSSNPVDRNHPEPMEPPAIATPSTVIPNWGGPAQIAHGDTGLGQAGNSTPPSSLDESNRDRNRMDVSQMHSAEDGSISAQGVTADDQAPPFAKGKGKAVSVEEAEDDE